jgi:hypothetical protein
MQEQPPDWYWDLSQAAWVPCEQVDAHEEADPAEPEPEPER